MTNIIPPEGDEYNKQREEELYASITNKSMLVRRHAEMLRDGAPLDQIAEAVAAMAQVERDIARISLELHNSTQGRNLNIFLMRFEEAIAANALRMEQIVKEKADADTIVLAGINNNLTLYNLTLEQVLQKLAQGEHERAALAEKLDLYIAGSKRGEVEVLRQGQEEHARRLSKIEQFDRDALSVRIDRLESIIADIPTRQHDPDARAVPERRKQRGSTRGAGGKGDTGE